MADCIAVSDRISVVPTEVGLPGGGDPPWPSGRQVRLNTLSSSSSSSWRNCQFRFHLPASWVSDGLKGFSIGEHRWKGNKSAERGVWWLVGGPTSLCQRGDGGWWACLLEGPASAALERTRHQRPPSCRPSLTAASPPHSSLG